MTAIQLYKFISDNELECHKCDDNDIIIFINDFMIEEFCRLVNFSGEDGVEMVMRSNYFGLKLLQICEYYDIDIEEFYSLTAD